jgi:hypothetical protein
VSKLHTKIFFVCELSAIDGYFHSPDHPQNYPNNHRERWIITADKEKVFFVFIVDNNEIKMYNIRESVVLKNDCRVELYLSDFLAAHHRHIWCKSHTGKRRFCAYL